MYSSQSQTANQQLNIGNILFGTLPATSTGFQLPTSGTIGIGTSTPFAKLAISLNDQDSSFYNNAFLISSSTGSATTTLFSVSNTGIVNHNLSGTTTLFTLAGQSLLTVGAGTNGNLGLGFGAIATPSFTVQNTAIGYQALPSPSTSFNTAIGYQALLNATSSGGLSTAVGHNALKGSGGQFTGSSNVAVGGNALTSISSGSFNTAIGYNALGGVTLGSNNSAVGIDSGISITTGVNNVLFGYEAGTKINTGYGNILIGSHVSNAVTGQISSGFGNIGLGNELWFPSETANNQLNIGNFLFGTLPATSTGLVVPTSGTIGIGTSTPFGKFAISLNNGDSSFYNNAFLISSSTASATSSLFVVQNNGYVGVGTSTPSAALSLLGPSMSATDTDAPLAALLVGGTGGDAVSNFYAGRGGGLTIKGGTGGAQSQNGFSQGGYGGTVSITGGNGGSYTGVNASGFAGFGGDVNISGGLPGSPGGSGNPGLRGTVLLTGGGQQIGTQQWSLPSTLRLDGNVSIAGGNYSGGGTANGGSLTFTSGTSYILAGGPVTFTTGSGLTGGGAFNITTGNSTSTGSAGSFTFTGGVASSSTNNATGGGFTIVGGAASSTNSTVWGGSIALTAGSGGTGTQTNGTGGSITLNGGAAGQAGGAVGNVILANTRGAVGIGTSTPSWALLSISADLGRTFPNNMLFAISSSTAVGSTTLFSVDNTGAASTTKLFGAHLATCATALTWTNGQFGCGPPGAAASTTLLADSNTFSGFNTFTKFVNLNPDLNTTSTVLTLGGRSLLNATTSTAANIFLGLESGAQITSGGQNTGFGTRALLNATSSTANTAIGYEALKGAATVSAGGNTAIGAQALTGLTSGFSNTAVGQVAGAGLTTGNQNVFMGVTSGWFTTTGSGNVAVGSAALFSISAGGASNNVLIGKQAGYSIADSYSNILVGAHDSTANVITSGSGNVGLGNELYFQSATANNQLNIGNFLFGTLPATSTGFQLPTSGTLGIGTSTPFGKLAISLNNGDNSFYNNAFLISSSTASATTTLFSIANTGTIGVNIDASTSTVMTLAGLPFIQRTAFGVGALAHHPNASLNLAVGTNALGDDLSSNFNTAIGIRAMEHATSGSAFANTAIGYQTMQGDITNFGGSFNVAVGGGSMNSITTGTGNTAIGYGAAGVVDGSGNTAVGYSAGTTLIHGSDDTLVGYNSGSLLTSGYGNILLGSARTANNLTSGFNNIGLGNNIFFQSATGNSQLNIGNILFGTLPATTTSFQLPTSGTIGIGTSTPFAKLAISLNDQDSSFFNNAFIIASSTASATSTLFAVSNTGIASTTGLVISNAGGTGTRCLQVGADGTVSANASACGSGSSAYPFTPSIYGGQTVSATSTGLWLTGSPISLAASSSILTYASSTMISASSGFYINGETAVVGNAVLNNFFFGGATATSSLLSGIFNYAIGFNAMGNATSSSFTNNFAVGVNALHGSSTVENTGGSNIAIGANSLTNNTSGASNIALGNGALINNSSGSNNAAFGASALQANFSGADNIAIGNGALFFNTAGSGNIAFGNATLRNNTGSNNFAFGKNAGRVITSGYSNIMIGDNTQATGGITTGFGNIGLGANTFFETQTGNSQLNIGNILFGTLPATSTGFQLPTSGTLGIGTSTPFGKFAISLNDQDSSFYNNAFVIASSTGSATTTLFSVSNAGNVTVGGTATSTFAGFIDVNGTGANSTSTFASNLWVKGTLRTGTGSFYLNDGGLTSSNGNVNINASATSSIGTNGFTVGNLTVQAGSGFVGIGTSSPYAMLSIAGNVVATNFISTSTAASTIVYASSTSQTISNLFSTNATSSSLAITSVAAGSILKTTTGGAVVAAVAGADYVAGANPFTFSTQFGTANTAASSSAFQITGGFSASSTVRFGNAGVSGQFIYDAVNGRVGIGTTSPYKLLSISNAGADSAGRADVAIIGSGTAGSGVTLQSTDTGGREFSILSTGSGYAGGAGDLQFFDVVNSATRLSIDTAGNIGVASTSPFGLFSVNPNGLTGGAPQFVVGSSSRTSFAVANNGNVGIGTSSPFALFTIFTGTTTNMNLNNLLFAIASTTSSGTGATSTIFAISNTGSTTIAGALNVSSTGSFTNLISSGSSTIAGVLNVSGLAPSTIVYASSTALTAGNFFATNETISGNSLLTNATTTNLFASGGLFGNTAYFGGTGTTTITSAGLLGVGTSTPWGMLSINPNGLTGHAPAFVVGSTTNPFPYFLINNGGHIGIGTSSPYALLSIYNATTSNILAGASSTLFSISSSTSMNGQGSAVNLFSVDKTGVTTIGDTSGTGDANFQFASDGNAWNMGYNSSDKSFRIASSTNLASNVAFAITKNLNVLIGTSTLGSNVSTTTVFLVDSGAAANSIVAAFGGTTSYCFIQVGKASITCSSDARLKQNVTALPTALDSLMALRPVSYNWKTENGSSTPHFGFIAQEVQQVMPDLISAGPNGYLGMDYAGLTPYLVQGEQIFQRRLEALSTSSTSTLGLAIDLGTTTDATTSDSVIWAHNFFASLYARLTIWLGDAGNGIAKIFTKELVAERVETKELCLTDDSGAKTCITKSQLDSILQSQAAGVGGAVGGSSGGASSPVGGGDSSGTGTSSSTSTGDTLPPVISIQGNNPATVNIGNVYNDLGASVHDNVDKNLGIKAMVDGGDEIDLSAIQIDTSASSTHTIIYSSTDNSGNTGYATRTVHVVDPLAGQALAGQANAGTTSTSTASVTPPPAPPSSADTDSTDSITLTASSSSQAGTTTDATSTTP
jgi:hypothetical protein